MTIGQSALQDRLVMADPRRRAPQAVSLRQVAAPRTVAPKHLELLKSVATGLQIFECFGSDQHVLNLDQLAAMLGAGDASKVRPYTSVLLAGEYLEQTAAQDYRLGARAGDVALAMLDTLPVRWHARKALQRLRERTGYTASLVALDGPEAVYISRMTGSRRGQHSIDDGIGVGARLPAHRTAAGKALIAHLRPQQRKSLITELVLKYRGPDDAPAMSAMHRECMSIIRTGLAVSSRAEPPQRSIATPVADERNAVVAAIEVSMPDEEARREALIETLGPQMLKEAKTILLADDDDFLDQPG